MAIPMPSVPHDCPAKGCTCPKCPQCGHREVMHCRTRGCQVILHFDKDEGFLLCGYGPGVCTDDIPAT
jgi:hypothetical protein